MIRWVNMLQELKDHAKELKGRLDQLRGYL